MNQVTKITDEAGHLPDRPVARLLARALLIALVWLVPIMALGKVLRHAWRNAHWHHHLRTECNAWLAAYQTVSQPIAWSATQQAGKTTTLAGFKRLAADRSSAKGVADCNPHGQPGSQPHHP